MILDKHSQAMKLGVLQKIRDLMDSIEAKPLAGKKPDIAAISIEAKPEDEAAESPADEAAEMKDGTEECDEGGDEDLKRLMAEYEARLK